MDTETTMLQEVNTTLVVDSAPKEVAPRVQFYITMPDEMQRVLNDAMSCYSELKQGIEKDWYADMSADAVKRYRALDALHRLGQSILNDFVSARQTAGKSEAEIESASMGLKSKLDGIGLVLERAGMALEKAYGIKVGETEKLQTS